MLFTRRQIDFPRALRELAVVGAPAGARAAAFRAQANASNATRKAKALPLVVAGRFDRSAIMRAAVAAARSRQDVTGEPWSLCMSDALRGTWAAAKAKRLASAH